MVFARRYGQMMHWAAPRHVPRYLVVLSFAESSPLPYKVFTITAGAASMALLASFFGRGAWSMHICTLIAAFGSWVEPWVKRWVEWLGWLSIRPVVFTLFWLNVRG